MAIFTKNIPKHTDQSVCHNKKTLKTRRKQATAVRVSATNFLYLWQNTAKKQKIYILATQSKLHNIYNKKNTPHRACHSKNEPTILHLLIVYLFFI